MSKPKKGLCRDCAFWEPDGRDQFSGAVGVCRASTPVMNLQVLAKEMANGVLHDKREGDFGLWPMTVDEDWCGSWVYREPE